MATPLAYALGLAAVPWELSWLMRQPLTGLSPRKHEVRLISANQGVSGDKIVRLGLQIKLQKGWKVYWRTPGDAGFPPGSTGRSR